MSSSRLGHGEHTAYGKQSQADLCEVRVNLVYYIGSSRSSVLHSETCFLFLLFETGSHYTALAGMEFAL